MSQIVAKTRHPARGRGHPRHIVGSGICVPGLTMAETPTDSLDGLGEASTNLAISLRGVGQLLVAWALMLRPPMFRSCPFLIIAIAS
jgi:hypothetical protein